MVPPSPNRAVILPTNWLCVQVQGLIISQMLRKSVETRDWVNTIEPRNVRAVMKRVVEDTTSIDVQVKLTSTQPALFLIASCDSLSNLNLCYCFLTG